MRVCVCVFAWKMKNYKLRTLGNKTFEWNQKAKAKQKRKNEKKSTRNRDPKD